MAVLQDEKSRTDLLHRLKRAEGQLRGIQRMIEEGEECLAIAGKCLRPSSSPVCMLPLSTRLASVVKPKSSGASRCG